MFGSIVKAILDFIWGILRADTKAKTVKPSPPLTRDWARKRLWNYRNDGSGPRPDDR